MNVCRLVTKGNEIKIVLYKLRYFFCFVEKVELFTPEELIWTLPYIDLDESIMVCSDEKLQFFHKVLVYNVNRQKKCQSSYILHLFTFCSIYLFIFDRTILYFLFSSPSSNSVFAYYRVSCLADRHHNQYLPTRADNSVICKYRIKSLVNDILLRKFSEMSTRSRADLIFISVDR